MSERREIERFDVGADLDHQGFSEMHAAADGNWVHYLDHLAQLRARIEELQHENDTLLADRLHLTQLLEQLRNGPDTLTPDGLRVVNDVLANTKGATPDGE